MKYVSLIVALLMFSLPTYAGELNSKWANAPYEHSELLVAASVIYLVFEGQVTRKELKCHIDYVDRVVKGVRQSNGYASREDVAQAVADRINAIHGGAILMCHRLKEMTE